MNRDYRLSILVLLILFVGGTAINWYFASEDFVDLNQVMSYLIFLAVLAGFAVMVYLLKVAEETLKESIPMPALRIEVLPPSDMPGQYRSQKTDHLVLIPDEGGSVFRTHCALRIENTGSLPASKIFFSFVFLRKPNSKIDAVSRLVVDYNQEKQQHAKCTQCDVDVRDGYPVGYILRIEDALVVYPDPNDKHIVAELELIVKAPHFENNFEIRYRIQPAEGNRYINSNKDAKTGLPIDQVYAISFERGGRAEQTV